VSGTRDTFGTPDELLLHMKAVAGPLTWEWMEKRGHDLKGCDGAIATAVANWVRPRG